MSKIRFEKLLWLMPAAFAPHIAEEYIGDFPGWVNNTLHGQFDNRLFALNNALFMALMLGLSLWASRSRSRQSAFVLMSWSSGNLFWDFLLPHLIGTALYGVYSPGLLTAAILYYPVNLWVAWACWRDGRLGVPAIAAAFAVGLSLLGLVIWGGLFHFASPLSYLAPLTAYPKSTTPIPIAIVSNPVDWANIITAIAASALGAGAAILFSIIYERRREMKLQLQDINAAIYGLAITLDSLINLKEQYFGQHEDQFARLRQALGGAAGTAPDQLNAQYRASQIFQEILRSDNTMGAAFLLLQEDDFPMMPQPERFYFTIIKNPNLPRLMHVAVSETNQVSKTIVLRNNLWREDPHKGRTEILSGAFSPETAVYYFQMLTFRHVLKEHVDMALVLINEVLDQLRSNRQQTFRKQAGLRGQVSELLFGPQAWADYQQSSRIKRAIPDRNKYKSILEVTDEE